jgi:nucleotide-binding universal stress UspA family protein
MAYIFQVCTYLAGRILSFQIRRILVAFDGSNDALKAVGVACSLAKKYGSSVTIAHVYSVEAFAYAGAAPVPIPDFQPLEDAAKARGRAILDKGLKKAKEDGVDATEELIEAPSVVQALVELAAKKEVDLIVAGTRGMTGFKKLIMGSVSEGVLHHVHCSVLVVR